MARIVSLLLLLYTIIAAQQATQDGYAELSVYEVKALIDSAQQILLLDVRTESEYTGSLGHIDSTMLIPVQDLTDRISELKPYQDHDIIVICRSGNRSRQGTKILRQAGFNAYNMAGGMLAWNEMRVEKHNEK